jgi:hypothetical protein
MNEEQVKIPEKKTHSIVELSYELRLHHVGEPVAYEGVSGKLIRYIPKKGVLMELTLTEAMQCLDENRSKESA